MDVDLSTQPDEEAPTTAATPDPEPPVYGAVASTPATVLPGATTWRNPTLAADGGRLGALDVAAATIAGLRHQQEGTSGQDAYSFASSPDGSTIAVGVADGLGSRPNSQIGSAQAVRLACDYLVAQDDDVMFEYPVDFAVGTTAATNAALRQYRAEHHASWDDRELGTTLAFAWLRQTPDGWRAIVGRIGDTDVFMLHDQTWDSPFERGDGALNAVDQNLPVGESSSLTPDGIAIDLEPGAALILATDGLSEDVRSSPAIRSRLAECWSEAVSAPAMLDTISYRRRGSHDDRTALVVWIPADVAEEPPREEGPPIEPPTAESPTGTSETESTELALLSDRTTLPMRESELKQLTEPNPRAADSPPPLPDVATDGHGEAEDNHGSSESGGEKRRGFRRKSKP